jgi:peptidyl-tRNA hydrolase, PTH1 family
MLRLGFATAPRSALLSQRLVVRPSRLLPISPLRQARVAPACASPGAVRPTSPNTAAGQIEKPRPKPKPKHPRGDKLLLVGLGNPGPQFDNTRHNIGFMAVNEFAARNGSPAFKHEKKFQADVASVRIGGTTIHVIKPRTYMNNSGAALRAVMDYHKLTLSAVLVVADDMALELGRLRLRAKGSPGGHNGLKSVEKHVGGQEYARLKLGVGEPCGGADAWSDHVLGKFSRGDMKIVDGVMWDSMDIIEEWVKEEDISRILNNATRRNSA